MSYEIDSCSAWGCTWCAGGALTNFPCKLRLKFSFFALKCSPPWRCKYTHCKLRLKIFLRPGGAGAPTAPPGYAYARTDTVVRFTDFTDAGSVEDTQLA